MVGRIVLNGIENEGLRTHRDCGPSMPVTSGARTTAQLPERRLGEILIAASAARNKKSGSTAIAKMADIFGRSLRAADLWGQLSMVKVSVCVFGAKRMPECPESSPASSPSHGERRCDRPHRKKFLFVGRAWNAALSAQPAVRECVRPICRLQRVYLIGVSALRHAGLQAGGKLACSRPRSCRSWMWRAEAFVAASSFPGPVVVVDVDERMVPLAGMGGRTAFSGRRAKHCSIDLRFLSRRREPPNPRSVSTSCCQLKFRSHWRYT
jgi:hypothetical protein